MSRHLKHIYIYDYLNHPLVLFKAIPAVLKSNMCITRSFECIHYQPQHYKKVRLSLATVKRRKLAWFGHVTRNDSLFQGTLEGGRRRRRQRKCWMDNVKEWTSLPMPELLTRTSCKKDWTRTSAESTLMPPPTPPPPHPTTQSVNGLN